MIWLWFECIGLSNKAWFDEIVIRIRFDGRPYNPRESSTSFHRILIIINLSTPLWPLPKWTNANAIVVHLYLEGRLWKPRGCGIVLIELGVQFKVENCAYKYSNAVHIGKCAIHKYEIYTLAHKFKRSIVAKHHIQHITHLSRTSYTRFKCIEREKIYRRGCGCMHALSILWKPLHKFAWMSLAQLTHCSTFAIESYTAGCTM